RGRSAPAVRSSASRDAFSVTAAYDEPTLNHGRQARDTLCRFENLLRDSFVRGGHNFIEYSGCCLRTLDFVGLIAVSAGGLGRIGLLRGAIAVLRVGSRGHDGQDDP